jgi:hypothetical protein
MPGQRVAGIVELLVADDFGQPARDLVPAAVADQRLHAFQWKRGPGGKRAAELAAVIFTALRNRLARDQEPMTRGTDVLPCSLKHLVGNVARIAPAHRSSVSVDCFGEFKGVGYRLLEHRMQNFNHEFHRRIIVVVKDHLEMAGLGVNIGHWIVPPDQLSFRHIASRSPFKIERNRNKVTTPRAQESEGARCEPAFAKPSSMAKVRRAFRPNH